MLFRSADAWRLMVAAVAVPRRARAREDGTSSSSCSHSRSSLVLDGVPLAESRESREASVAGARTTGPLKNDPGACEYALACFAVAENDEAKASKMPCSGLSGARVKAEGIAERLRSLRPLGRVADAWRGRERSLSSVG